MPARITEAKGENSDPLGDQSTPSEQCWQVLYDQRGDKYAQAAQAQSKPRTPANDSAPQHTTGRQEKKEQNRERQHQERAEDLPERERRGGAAQARADEDDYVSHNQRQHASRDYKVAVRVGPRCDALALALGRVGLFGHVARQDGG
jgi:hypothetical protein